MVPLEYMGLKAVAANGSNHELKEKNVECRLNTFWEQTRGLYAPYESDVRSASSDVYQHEMPGGQFTNLKFQVCLPDCL